jgi:GNAT superfamily N-acetyltransferase
VTDADRLVIAESNAADIELFADWAAAEGWNPGLGDAAAFHATDPGGFLLGRLDGEPVASISLVRYDDRYAFLGFYIVRPEFRGRGLGLRIWNEAIGRAGDRVVGLDGVVAQQPSYAKSGFRLARRNVRYEGLAGAGSVPSDAVVVPLTELPFDRLAAYDDAVFPVSRPAFLREWLAMPGIAAFGAVDAGRLAGYGVVRPCRAGSKIGPLFADDASLAALLFEALRAVARPGPLFIDVPDPNAAGVALVTSRGFTPMFETARMYRGDAPAEPVERIFGVTTFELG